MINPRAVSRPFFTSRWGGAAPRRVACAGVRAEWLEENLALTEVDSSKLGNVSFRVCVGFRVGGGEVCVCRVR